MRCDVGYGLRMGLAVLATLPLLAGCGLRGGLERPDPIFRNVEPVERIELPEEVETEPGVIIRERTNEYGGEIPDAAPTAPVQSTPLDEPKAPDDE